MRIFLDTAKIEEIKKAKETGLIEGVTTNPTLIYQAGGDFNKRIEEICRLIQGPVSVEVLSLDFEGMIREARELSQIAPNVVVKIPVSLEGLKALNFLTFKVKTNATLVFSLNQALLAAKAKADFVSPFVGRLDDIGESGMELVKNILTIYRNYNFKTKVIVASVRHPQHVFQAALLGADICTIPFSVFEKLFLHPLTEQGIQKFLEDWQKIRSKNGD